MSEPLLTADEVAAMLNITVPHVRRLAKRARSDDPQIRAKGLPSVRFGHYLRFEGADVQAFKDRNRVAVVDPMAPSKASASRRRRT